MKFKLHYPFVEFIEKMSEETEQDFYMHHSWGRVKNDNSLRVRLSRNSIPPVNTAFSILERKKIREGLYAKCKYANTTPAVVCLSKNDFNELINMIEDKEDKRKLISLFEFSASELNLFENHWFILYFRKDGEFFEDNREEE